MGSHSCILVTCNNQGINHPTSPTGYVKPPSIETEFIERCGPANAIQNKVQRYVFSSGGCPGTRVTETIRFPEVYVDPVSGKIMQSKGRGGRSDHEILFTTEDLAQVLVKTEQGFKMSGKGYFIDYIKLVAKGFSHSHEDAKKGFWCRQGCQNTAQVLQAKKGTYSGSYGTDNCWPNPPALKSSGDDDDRKDACRKKSLVEAATFEFMPYVHDEGPDSDHTKTECQDMIDNCSYWPSFNAYKPCKDSRTVKCKASFTAPNIGELAVQTAACEAYMDENGAWLPELDDLQ